MRKASEAVLKAVAVTCELMGTEVGPEAARVMAHDLALYDERQVLAALTRCRKEVRGRLTIADVIDRLEDGRPGAEEAWAECPRDEHMSVVWCEEQIQAWAAARTLLDEGEVVQARMTFLEVYRRLCREARERAEPVRWTPSLGYDEGGRERAILAAIDKGRLQPAQAAQLLPSLSYQVGRAGGVEALLERANPNAGLPAPNVKRLRAVVDKAAKRLPDNAGEGEV